jgi:hypothetical protein
LGDCKTSYGISFSYSEKYTAIKQWNRRAPDADRAALLGLLRELRKALGLATETLGHDKWLSSQYETALWRAQILPGLEARAALVEPQEGKE